MSRGISGTMPTSPSRSDGLGHVPPGPVRASGTGCVAGVDLGGTRMRVGLVDPGGKILRSIVVPSSTGLPPGANPGYLADLVEGLLAERGLDRGALLGIGIGTTGPVDTVTGRIDNPYTLPGWSGVGLIAPLVERFGIPVRIDNDAVAAALGEYWLGRGAGSERLAMLTVGTGIGGALVIDGRPYCGARGFHPELGHQVVDPSGPACYCGASGCLEQLAAGPAIGRAWAAVRRSRGDGVSGQGTAEDLFAAGRAGDADACALISTIAGYLGLGLINVVACFAPDLIVLGGGVAQHFDLLEPGMRAALERFAGCQPPGGTGLRASALGEAAGILGGAYMVLSPA